MRAIDEKRLMFLDDNAGFDYVLESHNAGRFTEFVVRHGGDVLTYRVYGESESDFELYER